MQLTVPEINITGNGVSIADGDTTPTTADHTDFGSCDNTTGSRTRTFTIQNTGTQPLNLTGTPRVSVNGTNAADFTVVASPEASVTAGGSTTFQVTFNPSDIGARTAELSIDSDDDDENPYTFAIQGRGTRALIVSGVTAADKNYDGGTATDIDCSGASLVGVVGGQQVTLNPSSVSGSFSSDDVGTGKTVNIVGIALTGADSANYTVTQPTATASILPKPLTVTGITASSRVYNGTTAATINTGSATLNGIVSPDTVTLDKSSASGTFSDSARRHREGCDYIRLGADRGGCIQLLPEYHHGHREHYRQDSYRERRDCPRTRSMTARRRQR